MPAASAALAEPGVEHTESKERAITVPAYLTRFSCLGGACEDNCCTAGWNIAIDVRTMARYQAATGDWGPRLRDAVVRNPARKATAEDFGRLKLDQHRQCPFFTPEGWCGVQQQLGEEWLSNVCLSYPRRTVLLDGQLERAASLSCPEIARLALLSPAAMEPVVIDEPKNTRVAFTGILSRAGLEEDHPRRLIAPIRQGCLELFRHTESAIEARLVALGLALQRLDRWSKLGLDDVEAVFAAYTAELPAVEEQLASLTAEPAVQLELLRELTIERLATGRLIRSPRFEACIARLGRGLRLGLSSVGGETIELYSRALREIYQPFVRTRPHILDNYIQNQLWAGAFPFGGRRLLDDYALLVLRFALIRLLLVGAAAGCGELNDSAVVEVIQPFERAVTHDPGFLKHVLAVLRRNRSVNLPFLATLIVS
ncbi:MAG TPA: flagellin lysine-N-methylase [Chloroflexota bacterium]